MKGMLYVPGRDEPVAVLDDADLVEYNDNHTTAPLRVYYKSRKLNAGRSMAEMRRDEPMTLRLEDGRSGRVLLQHTSIDMEGNAVGVLRVVGPLEG